MACSELTASYIEAFSEPGKLKIVQVNETGGTQAVLSYKSELKRSFGTPDTQRGISLRQLVHHDHHHHHHHHIPRNNKKEDTTKQKESRKTERRKERES